MKKNSNFWTDVATCKDLKGNDLRVVMLCYNRDCMQKDIQSELVMKKSNCSTIVNKLWRMGLLERTEAAGTYFYRTNESWELPTPK